MSKPLLQKLKDRENRERTRAMIKISDRYWALKRQAAAYCEHEYGVEYIRRDYNSATGTSCNIFHTPFIYKECTVCGHESYRLLDEDNNESMQGLKYR
jgi:hypothetical protein